MRWHACGHRTTIHERRHQQARVQVTSPCRTRPPPGASHCSPPPRRVSPRPFSGGRRTLPPVASLVLTERPDPHLKGAHVPVPGSWYLDRLQPVVDIEPGGSRQFARSTIARWSPATARPPRHRREGCDSAGDQRTSSPVAPGSSGQIGRSSRVASSQAVPLRPGDPPRPRVRFLPDWMVHASAEELVECTWRPRTTPT